MNKPLRNITIIGSGNVAFHLTRAFQAAGLNVLQIYSRNKTSLKEIHDRFKVDVISDPGKLSLDADIYILAVKDDNINDAASLLKFGDALLVHTSGSAPMEILDSHSANTGVFYPLQTLNREKDINFINVPMCIEANTESNLGLIHGLASSISDKVIPMDSQQRQMAHLAAVFASNFTNHMYAIAASILEMNKLPFDILAPLITETAAKAISDHPLKKQTGPAVRKDMKIIEKHMKILEDNKMLREIYDLISKSIIDKNSNPDEEL